MEQKDSLRYLLIMAAADGGIAREELRLLADRAVMWGITDDVFEGLLDEATSGQTELLLPSSLPERQEILQELIFMMAADGRLDPREKQFFARLMSRMDMPPGSLDRIIDAAITEREEET